MPSSDNPYLRNNIAANFIGKAFAALSIFIFVPIYLRYIGPDAYGLIGFYATIQTIAFLADFGLSGAFTRKCAQYSDLKHFVDELRDLGKTFEGLFAAIGLIITVVIALLSGKISSSWVHSATLPHSSIRTAICLMGVATGLQFPFFVYQGGLLGLQRQVSLNILLVSIGLLRGIGAILLLQVWPSIVTFFIWQAVVTVIQALAGRTLLWRVMPAGNRTARLRPESVKQLWRFATGMAGISITSIILTQADKVILSRVLNLENFGYYSLAVMVAGIPYLLAWPINIAAYPKFTQLASADNTIELAKLYHIVAQLTALVVLPVGAILFAYPYQIMHIWTGNPQTAGITAGFVRLLSIGSTALALMYIPFALQLAYGWTKLTFGVNAIASVIIVPALLFLSPRFGATGVCILWTAMNIITGVVTIWIMHRRLLPGACKPWFLKDVFLPTSIAVCAVVLAKSVMPLIMSPTAMALFLVLNWTIATTAILSGTPHLRVVLGSQLNRLSWNKHKEPQK